MATKARKKRKPVTTLVPINFKLCKENANFLKNAPQIALLKFLENKATATHWYNFTVRMRMARALAPIEGFDDHVLEELEKLVAITEAIRLRNTKEQPLYWIATSEELEQMNLGIEIVNEMQDLSLRRSLLKAHRIAQKELRPFLA